MIQKEVAELKRRYKKDNASFTRVCGCYVDANKNKVCTFNQRFLSLAEEEFFKYLDIAKKSLSGKMGNNLLNLEFPMEEEKSGGKQQILMALRESKLENEDLLNSYYDHIIDVYDNPGNYLILLFHDVYDIFIKSVNDETTDISEEAYEHLICSICPVTLSKPALGYKKDEHRIGARELDWVVGVPETAFLFPSFTDRTTNIHEVLFYTKNTKEPHNEFVELGLGCEPKTTLAEKKIQFDDIIKNETIEDNSDFVDVMLDIQQTINETIEMSSDAVVLDKITIEKILDNCDSIPNDKISKLTKKIDDIFKEDPPAAESFVNEKELESNVLRLEKAELEKKIVILEKQISELKDALNCK